MRPGAVAREGGPAPPAPEAGASRRERKVASILFADLVGFTGLNERHDPEVVQALVTRAFERLSEEVARYEGTLEKFAGDAVLAVFGVPQVHEDDAERAVRAALEMQTAMAELAAGLREEDKPELGLRVGVETGEVLVDPGRAANERDRLVTGDPVNTAARLQAAAPPGGVLVGPGAYAATRTVVEYEELAPLTLKGKSQPVPAWRAVSVKARRGGVRSPLGIEAPLVGRDAELALLKETVRRTVVDRRPHLVTVVGAPGVGKSRLTWELEKYLDGLPEVYLWRKGRCLAYAQASFGALADLFRTDAKILEDDPPDSADEKLAARLGELGMADDRDALAVLRGVLGLAPVPPVGRDGLFDTWRRYFEALARVAPTVIVLEDIHWADDGLLDIVEATARWGDGPMMVLCLARHELLERRPAWGGGIPNATSIVLEPLAAEDNTRLLEGLMPGGIPPELQGRIVDLAEGNPLFTEELVRMFVDQGVIRFVDGRWQLAQAVDELEVPGSVQQVLAARLDALPIHEKQLAQDASVVGRIFWDAVLAYLGGERPARVDEVLRRLRVKELVVPRQPSSLSGAAEFGFRHVLIRDVAYDSLPKRERAAKHLFVAQWAERELADRGEENAELLASHYVSALRYEEEFESSSAPLAELRHKALDHARAAGARAHRLFDVKRSAHWSGVALAIARSLGLPPGELAVICLEFLERSTGRLPLPQGESLSREALAWIAESPESPELTDVEAGIRANLAYVLHTLDRPDEAQATLRSMLARLDDGPPSHARAVVLQRLGWAVWRHGPVPDAIPILERALADARAIGADDVERWALHDLGISLAYTGHMADGIAALEESVRLARDAGDHQLVTRGYINLPSILIGAGRDWHEIMPLMDEAVAFSRRSGQLSSEAWVLWQKADLLEWLGRVTEALELVRAAVVISEALGEGVAVSQKRYAIAWLEAMLGHLEAADEIGIHPLTPDTEEQGTVLFVVWNAWMTWRADPAAAVTMLKRAMPDLTIERLLAALFLARIGLRTGDREAAQLAVRTGGTDRAEEGGAVVALKHLHLRALTLPEDEAGPKLLGIAHDMEELGYLTPAFEAAADAALCLARAGVDPTEALEMVRRIQESTGMVPVLGPVPEERWIAPRPQTATAASGG